jgi:hypothetical protein
MMTSRPWSSALLTLAAMPRKKSQRIHAIARLFFLSACAVQIASAKTVIYDRDRARPSRRQRLRQKRLELRATRAFPWLPMKNHEPGTNAHESQPYR